MNLQKRLDRLRADAVQRLNRIEKALTWACLVGQNEECNDALEMMAHDAIIGTPRARAILRAMDVRGASSESGLPVSTLALALADETRASRQALRGEAVRLREFLMATGGIPGEDIDEILDLLGQR